MILKKIIEKILCTGKIPEHLDSSAVFQIISIIDEKILVYFSTIETQVF